MAYKFLEHKADVLFEATAESFPALAEEAATALFETMAHTAKLKPSESVVVEARAKTLDELLVFTLANLLSESDANNSFYKSFKVTAFERNGDAYFLKGMASGSRRTVDAGKIEVKAVTLHECSVAEKDGAWKARVLLDV